MEQLLLMNLTWPTMAFVFVINNNNNNNNIQIAPTYTHKQRYWCQLWIALLNLGTTKWSLTQVWPHLVPPLCLVPLRATAMESFHALTSFMGLTACLVCTDWLPGSDGIVPLTNFLGLMACLVCTDFLPGPMEYLSHTRMH